MVTEAHQQGVSSDPERAGAQSFGAPQSGHSKADMDCTAFLAIWRRRLQVLARPLALVLLVRHFVQAGHAGLGFTRRLAPTVVFRHCPCRFRMFLSSSQLW